MLFHEIFIKGSVRLPDAEIAWIRAWVWNRSMQRGRGPPQCKEEGVHGRTGLRKERSYDSYRRISKSVEHRMISIHI